MDIDIVVVDGPNAYQRVADVVARLGEKEETLRYLNEWFDFDRLLYACMVEGPGLDAPWPPRKGIHLVHSDRGLGRDKTRIQNAEHFWQRQSQPPGCRDVPVRLSADEKADATFNCEECGHEQSQSTKSEKGVDATVIATLYERVGQWRAAALVSNDTDYAPVIDSLDRLGYPVSVVGRAAGRKRSALVRRSYEFIPMPEEWLGLDFEFFRWFRADGLMERLVAEAKAEGAAVGLRLPALPMERHSLEVLFQHKDEDAFRQFTENLDLPSWGSLDRRHNFSVLNVFQVNSVLDALFRYTGWLEGIDASWPDQIRLE